MMSQKQRTRSMVAGGASLLAACALAFSSVASAEQRERGDRPTVQPAPAAQAAQDDYATLRGHRVAVLIAEGAHDLETMVPIAFLVNRGAIVTVIGPEPGLVKAYNSDMTIRVERRVNDVTVRQFDALVIPGGRGPAVLREHDESVSFVRDFFNSGKPVAAICHGPQVLITAGVMEGRHATCFADVASELEEAGAKYDDKPVVRDGNLITSRVPDDIPAFCLKLEEVMKEGRQQVRPQQDGR